MCSRTCSSGIVSVYKWVKKAGIRAVCVSTLLAPRQRLIKSTYTNSRCFLEWCR